LNPPPTRWLFPASFFPLFLVRLPGPFRVLTFISLENLLSRFKGVSLPFIPPLLISADGLRFILLLAGSPTPRMVFCSPVTLPGIMHGLVCFSLIPRVRKADFQKPPRVFGKMSYQSLPPTPAKISQGPMFLFLAQSRSQCLEPVIASTSFVLFGKLPPASFPNCRGVKSDLPSIRLSFVFPFCTDTRSKTESLFTMSPHPPEVYPPLILWSTPFRGERNDYSMGLRTSMLPSLCFSPQTAQKATVTLLSAPHPLCEPVMKMSTFSNLVPYPTLLNEVSFSFPFLTYPLGKGGFT